MKVLMLGWELPPNNSGGLGVACLQLSKALSLAGADIDFILPYSPAQNYGFMRVNSAFGKGDQIFASTSPYDSRLSMISGGNWLNTNVHDQQAAFAQKVGRLIEQLEFDIIHAHDWLTFQAALLARQKKNVPLILHVHSIERDRAGGKPGNLWVREIEATAMLLADHIVAVSERTRQMIAEDYKIPADKIEVVHNSIDTSSLSPLDEENAYHYLADMKQAGWKVVANIGRLTLQKGLPHLIEAARDVIARRPKTIFLFVGDGEQRNELLEQAAENQISKNVIFAGFQRGKNWRDAYAISDLFVMPSVSEPFGLTPYEAAAYGSPSLISKQSGIAEVFRSCLKVDFWDTRLMADKILAVLSSDALQSELKNQAWAEFEKLSWQKAAGQLMDRYHYLREMAAA